VYFVHANYTPAESLYESSSVLDVDAGLTFAVVGVLVDERRPVDALHGGERRDGVAGSHRRADGVRVHPADRKDGHAATQALGERRFGRQRQVTTDVGRTRIARFQTEEMHASTIQPVVVDRVMVKSERQPMNRRLVFLAARHLREITTVRAAKISATVFYTRRDVKVPDAGCSCHQQRALLYMMAQKNGHLFSL